MRSTLIYGLLLLSSTVLAGGGHAHGGGEEGSSIACDETGDDVYDEQIANIEEYCKPMLSDGFVFSMTDDHDDHHGGGEDHGHDHGRRMLEDESEILSCSHECSDPLKELQLHYGECGLRKKHLTYVAMEGKWNGICLTKEEPKTLSVVHFVVAVAAMVGYMNLFLVLYDRNTKKQGSADKPEDEAVKVLVSNAEDTESPVNPEEPTIKDDAVEVLVPKAADTAESVVEAEPTVIPEPKLAMLFALATMLLFAVEDYAMAHSHSIAGAAYFLPVAYITMGIGATVSFPFFYWRDARFRETAKELAPWRLVSRMEGSRPAVDIICVYATGFALVGAQECTSRAFSLAIASAGPLHAIMSTDVVLVTLFFYFFASEKLSRQHMVCFVLMIGGSLTITFGPSQGGDGNYFGLALLWSLVALFFYGSWTITARISSLNGIYSITMFFVMWLVLGFYGVVKLIIVSATEDESLIDVITGPGGLEFLGFSVGAMGIVEFIAIVTFIQAVNKASQVGVCVAIWSSHAAVVTLLVWLFDGQAPPVQQIIGMCIAIIGIIGCNIELGVCKSKGGGKKEVCTQDAAL